MQELIKIAEGIGTIDDEIEGEILLIDNPLKYIGKCKGKIIAIEIPRPDIMILMKEAKAIISASGGLTCHVALVSREMGKPAIIGLSKYYCNIQNGMKVKIRIREGKGEIYEIREI